MLRVLRALPVTRRKMNPVVLRSVMKTFYTADGDRDTKDSLLKFVDQVRLKHLLKSEIFYIVLCQADELDGSLTPSRGKASSTPLYPEVEQYFVTNRAVLQCVFHMEAFHESSLSLPVD